jgi:hypothetical protein
VKTRAAAALAAARQVLSTSAEGSAALGRVAVFWREAA